MSSKNMATLLRLALTSLLFKYGYSHAIHLRQNHPSGVTKIDASQCPSPSCTVTFSVVSTLVVTPTPITVRPQGASADIVVTFEPITTSNIEAGTTVLANKDPKASLSLGTTTLPPLTVTAHTSYSVAPSSTASLEVVAVVKPETQMYFDNDNDNDGDSCPLPPSGLNSSPDQQTSLLRRLMSVQSFNTDNDKVQEWMADAKAIVTAAVGVMSAEDKSFKRFFRPQDFNTVKAAGSNILKALDPNDQTFKVILRPRTSEEVAKDEDNKCLGWKNIVALHWEEENPDPGRDCFTDIIVICPTQLKFTLDESVLPKQDGGPGGYSKAQMCDDAGLVSKGEEWEKFGGLTIIHELMHSAKLAKASGLANGANQDPAFKPEVYGWEKNRAETRADFRLNNADTYAWFFFERWLYTICNADPDDFFSTWWNEPPPP